jgi:nucleoside-diphosphate-sugar epimerase
VIGAVKVALVAKHSIRREYTLAGPEALTLRQMVEIILGQLGRRVWLVPVPIWLMMGLAHVCAFVQQRPRLTPDQVRRLGEDKVFDISDARRDLRFEPIRFEEGIRLKIAGSA